MQCNDTRGCLFSTKQNEYHALLYHFTILYNKYYTTYKNFKKYFCSLKPIL